MKTLREKMDEKMRLDGKKTVRRAEQAQIAHERLAGGYWERVDGRGGYFSPVAAAEERQNRVF